MTTRTYVMLCIRWMKHRFLRESCDEFYCLKTLKWIWLQFRIFSWDQCHFVWFRSSLNRMNNTHKNHHILKTEQRKLPKFVFELPLLHNKSWFSSPRLDQLHYCCWQQRLELNMVVYVPSVTLVHVHWLWIVFFIVI